MNTENRQNYYEVLDITENASQHEILAAYEKAKKTYSAENKALASVFSSDEADALRTLIEEAYGILSNNTYRNIYEKRMMAANTTPDALTIESIKAASVTLFERASLPVIEAVTTENETVIASENFVEENTDFKISNRQIDEAFEQEMMTRKEWTGEDLKKVREYRDLSFDELTDITKINPWYISAIELMDAANLPVKVFVRGYVIQIAKALGLKEKVVAESYMQNFSKKIEN